MKENKPSSRRNFLKTGALAGVAATFGVRPGRVVSAGLGGSGSRPPDGPVAISSRNGVRTVERAVEMMQSGADALDAVIAGVNLVEEDPNDRSVGYGGIPNEDGVVQLDSAVMHGPSCRAGAVGCLEGIMYPSKVARLVLQRTDHVLLVGKGAQDFARMHGFEVQDLLTDESRAHWVRWKEGLSDRDDYVPPPDEEEMGAVHDGTIERQWGTIHCSGIDLAGNISGVTTTSGLSFKIPGRVGDSPIIGAGIYLDNGVGAAGSTGRGEANLENLASFLIVERMRAGDAPQDACLYACRRIAEHTKLARLRDEEGRPNFNVKFYALNAAGDVGGGEIWGGDNRFAVADASGSRLVDLAYLYESG